MEMKSLFLVDSTETGNPILDQNLKEIVEESRQQNAQYWTERLAPLTESGRFSSTKSFIVHEITSSIYLPQCATFFDLYSRSKRIPKSESISFSLSI
jgi:hypothetical protein